MRNLQYGPNKNENNSMFITFFLFNLEEEKKYMTSDLTIIWQVSEKKRSN